MSSRPSTGAASYSIANLLAPALRDVIAAAPRAVRPGGWLILSGFRLGERSQVQSLLDAADLSTLESWEQGGWGALAARLPG